jgi:hypothetical protein
MTGPRAQVTRAGPSSVVVPSVREAEVGVRPQILGGQDLLLTDSFV